MQYGIKNLEEILQKLGITQLNRMQQEALQNIKTCDETVLLSPTGTGKTLAFLLPIVSSIQVDVQRVQVLVLAPSRELAMQIEQVARNMGVGIKTNAVFGGRPISQDKLDLKHQPALLIGTPGRVADHIRRGTVNTQDIETLVLDEFDKSLEVGFEEEMEEIISSLPNLKKRVLTSATQKVEIPKFVGLNEPKTLNYLYQAGSKLMVKSVVSSTKDKLKALAETLQKLANQPGIVFLNFKDSISRVSEYLEEQNISHGTFHGGMEQKDRELSLIKFRNGTHQLLLATDLAARGIDVPEIRFIIHYHLPIKKEEFTHRNGRTARMKSDGTAYVLHWEKEQLPDFIPLLTEEQFGDAEDQKIERWSTLMVSGGRRDKISKGDIAGFFFKMGKLRNDQVGMIEVKPDRAFVAVATNKVKHVISLLDNTRIKKKKVRVSLV